MREKVQNTTFSYKNLPLRKTFHSLPEHRQPRNGESRDKISPTPSHLHKNFTPKKSMAFSHDFSHDLEEIYNANYLDTYNHYDLILSASVTNSIIVSVSGSPSRIRWRSGSRCTRSVKDLSCSRLFTIGCESTVASSI